MMNQEKADLTKAQFSAFNLIKFFGIDKPDDIIIDDIAMARGVFVFEGELNGADARLIRKGNKGIIRVNHTISNIGRKRFSIAHELGHWELHPNHSQLDLYVETNFEEYKSNPMEQEADKFASELLMPTKLFRPLCDKVTPDLELIKNLASKFKTSLSATALRFIEETDHACIIVFSQNGIVVWWKKNRKCEGAWIEQKQKIHRESLAFCCANGEDFPKEGEMVNANVWFPKENRSEDNDNDDNKEEVFEQSVNLGYGSTIMTLLWLC